MENWIPRCKFFTCFEGQGRQEENDHEPQAGPQEAPVYCRLAGLLVAIQEGSLREML